jgi:hypothetical protein
MLRMRWDGQVGMEMKMKGIRWGLLSLEVITR